MLCPVRPSNLPGGGLLASEDEWEDPNESPLLDAPLQAPRSDIEDVVDADDGSAIQVARRNQLVKRWQGTTSRIFHIEAGAPIVWHVAETMRLTTNPPLKKDLCRCL